MSESKFTLTRYYRKSEGYVAQYFDAEKQLEISKLPARELRAPLQIHSVNALPASYTVGSHIFYVPLDLNPDEQVIQGALNSVVKEGGCDGWVIRQVDGKPMAAESFRDEFFKAFPDKKPEQSKFNSTDRELSRLPKKEKNLFAKITKGSNKSEGEPNLKAAFKAKLDDYSSNILRFFARVAWGFTYLITLGSAPAFDLYLDKQKIVHKAQEDLAKSDSDVMKIIEKLEQDNEKITKEHTTSIFSNEDKKKSGGDLASLLTEFTNNK